MKTPVSLEKAVAMIPQAEQRTLDRLSELVR
jgi:hypothetical protein